MLLARRGLYCSCCCSCRRCCGSASSISARSFALLAESFFSIDDFSGVVVREPTLETYAELLQPANLDIIVRTVSIAAVVTLLSIVVAFPIAYYVARYARGRIKALLYLAVMMPLWSSYLVKVYAWKLLLAKEGVIGWVYDHARPARRARLRCWRCR